VRRCCAAISLSAHSQAPEHHTVAAELPSQLPEVYAAPHVIVVYINVLCSRRMEARETEQPPQSRPMLKRKRSGSGPADNLPPTPPTTKDDPEGTKLLDRAVHVLSTAATALSQVTILYQSDPVARDGLLQAVECIKGLNEQGGKLIICGVGKSGLVGMKTVATMKSFGLATSFMHAAEGIHGDLGDIRAVSPALPQWIHRHREANIETRTTRFCSYPTRGRLLSSSTCFSTSQTPPRFWL
jgi:hypothetical protein